MKTKSDVNSFSQLFELISELARRKYQDGERLFSTIGLNHTEARLLNALYEEEGVCEQERLSSYLHVDRSNAGRGLKRLELEGYIERQRGGSDKRRNGVKMTEKGEKKAGEIHALREKMTESFFGSLTIEEATQAVTLLRKALENKPK